MLFPYLDKLYRSVPIPEWPVVIDVLLACFVAYKLAQVDIYRSRLRERQKRKDLARAYGLIHQASSSGVKKLIQDKRKYTKDQKCVCVAGQELLFLCRVYCSDGLRSC